MVRRALERILRAHRDERGVTLVIVTLTLVSMVGIMVLVVDVGGLLWRRRQMVSAADAAALAAAQSCALGESKAGDPETQANLFAVDNVAGLTPEGGIVWADTVNCAPEGGGEGHVKVEYSATQDLWFAGIFGQSSADVVTSATAEWGSAASGWPVPFIVTLSNTGNVFCKNELGEPVEITDTTPIGVRCAVWFDQSSTGGFFGGFDGSVFGSLNLNKWDVPADSNCGSKDLDDAKHYAYVGGYDADEPLDPLNYPDPTWVCNGDGGNASLYDNLDNSKGKILIFPITDRQVIENNAGFVDKFNVVGFVALYLQDVYKENETGPAVTSCPEFSWTPAVNPSIDLDLQPCVTRTPSRIENLVVTKDGGPGACCGLNNQYTFDETTHVLSWKPTVPTRPVKVTFDWLVDGPCGPSPNNASAQCLVVRWEGAQLGNGPFGGQNVGVPAVRLCDPTIPGSCDTES